MLLSNGASWFVTSSNRMAGNTRFTDTTGVYQIDMAVDTYLISSNGGAVTAQLPPANAARGDRPHRSRSRKRTDRATHVTVTVQGSAPGPDNYELQPLTAQYARRSPSSSNGSANGTIVSANTLDPKA